MEEAPVTAATGALGPVIAKLAALLGSEYKLPWRTRRDIKFIRSKLEPVHSILWNIWEKEELDAASKALKLEALDLADKVDDAIVDFILSMERSPINKRLVQIKIKASPFKDFKKRASDVSGRCCSKWKEKEKPSGDNSSPASKPRAYPFVRKDASELVGMDFQEEKIISHLIEEDEKTPVELELKTASIYGPAGTGKTTLADLVYEGIKDKFQSCALASVARPGGDMREVLGTILQQVAPNSSVPLAGTRASAEEHLIDIISNFLKDKRYLVIIDDIWNWREWEIILKSLPENNLGSRIVRTTRMIDIANKWLHPHDPNDLRHDMLIGWQIAEEWVDEIGSRNIFRKMVGMMADFVGEGFDYNHPIVHMCGGTPLAIHCMFSAVAKEREKQGEYAKTCDLQDEIEKHVMENGIQNTPGFEALVESLQLGYDDLPHHMLKTCLLYCSIYPVGHSFESFNLVRRWISERLVYTEEQGNSYFEELLDRGLIVRKPSRGSVTSLRMHPMMRNFLRWKSRQDKFIICSSEITPSSSIRRLCICNNYPGSPMDATGDPLSALDWYRIRSLVVCEGIDRVPFQKLEGVRVLDLCWTESLVDQNLKDIFGLVRLSHLLGLNGNGISEIPSEIVKLQRLETFEAEGGGLVGGFIGNLQQLKTLRIRGEGFTKLPGEIGSLQKLHTLRISDTHVAELPKEIGELQQLNILDISDTPIKALPKEIGELHELKTLDITRTHITVLPKVIGKLQHLEHLLMTGTKVAKIPREIGALKKLKTFRLDDLFVAPTLPLEACTLVELPECIHQAINKSGLLSELAEEMLSFQKSRYEITGDGGLVVGAKQMDIPLWIREHFNDVVLLDIRICKLEEKGLKILREMPQLVELTLRFEVVPREAVVISSQGFAALNFLVVDSRVPRVTFKEGAMPELFSLTFQFQFYAGPPNTDPMGINHLKGLCYIEFECNKDWYGGGDSPCIRPTIDVVKKEAQKLRHMNKFRVCGLQEELMEQGETEEEEEEWSSGEGEIEKEEEECSSGECEIEKEGETEEEEEEEWSNGEGEIEKEGEKWSSGESEIEEEVEDRSSGEGEIEGEDEVARSSEEGEIEEDEEDRSSGEGEIEEEDEVARSSEEGEIEEEDEVARSSEEGEIEEDDEVARSSEEGEIEEHIQA